MNAHTLKQTGMAASAGTLGYHGPFADAILSAMPNTKSVTNGFWTRPFATHTEASTFCEAVRKDLAPDNSEDVIDRAQRRRYREIQSPG